ncbi:hypothetical protein GSY69_02920 [Brevibacterium sp. 5221]|uniref:DNA-3-methyladenine glycosylase AlkA N-terminal domain-containing protein n=1 Tax=Brevibacterium rongguiense TaxID=2695267 RepID=A0A6N9H4G9_9MICO|nr:MULTISPECIES: AlkA N-terminal domain-containing protein [Brevibacterium]MYM18957.1 hypothetical protein [Brevibacterium rongguiense]WAL40805.1 hypothetical protein BRM1_02740 [Brevibacterium sp. BRM-1]
MEERDLALPAPYDAPGVFAFLSHRAIRGVEHAQRLPGGRLRYARTLHLPGGPGACEVTFAPAPRTPAAQVTAAHAPAAEAPATQRWAARARLELAREDDADAALATVRALFDLDTDPAAVGAALAGNPLTAQAIAARPGVRVPGIPDAPEALLRAISGQQIAVARAVGYLGEAAEHLGTPYRPGGSASAFEGLSVLVPTAAQLAEGIPPAVPGKPDPARPLRLPARSTEAIRALAADLAAGRLVLESGARSTGADASADDPAAALSAYAGVGEWSAGYVRMRLLRDPDVWLGGDMYLRGIDAEGCRPWRSYAGMLVWLF